MRRTMKLGREPESGDRPLLQHRLRAAYLAWPSRQAWLFAATQALWLLPLLCLLGWLGGFIAWRPALGSGTWTLLAVAFVFPAFAEETVFRVAIIPPGHGGRTAAAALLSVFLFVSWHPIQSRLYWVPWRDLAFDPWFLAAVAALGAACTRIWLRTGSAWPCVALHWSVVALWKALFGAPLAFPHL
jgi:predicted Abi (CAAX) family protease